jgi:hypothetical protein
MKKELVKRRKKVRGSGIPRSYQRRQYRKKNAMMKSVNCPVLPVIDN